MSDSERQKIQLPWLRILVFSGANITDACFIAKLSSLVQLFLIMSFQVERNISLIHVHIEIKKNTENCEK